MLVNNAVAATTVIANGTGGAAAVNQNADYPDDNLADRDRSTPYQTSAAPASPQIIDVDLGAGTIPSITAAAILGLRYFDSTKDLATVDILSGAALPATTARGTITVPAVTAQGQAPRDAGAIITTATSRYWRFTHNFRGSAGMFSLGKLCLGAVVDMGAYFSSGSTDDPVRVQQISKTITGATEILDYGDPSRDIMLKFSGVQDAMRTIALKLAELPYSFVYIDPADNFYEVRLRDSRVGNTRLFPASQLGDLVVALERLP